MLPKDCPEAVAFRCSIFECVWKQSDTQNDFVRPVRKYACAVFRQKLAPELDLVLVFGLALGDSDTRRPFSFSKNHCVRCRNTHIDFRAAGDQGVGVGDAAPEGDFRAACLCIRQVISLNRSLNQGSRMSCVARAMVPKTDQVMASSLCRDCRSQ